MINAISSAVSGLTTQSTKLAVGALNVANAGTKGSLDPSAASQAYEAREVLSVSTTQDGVTGGVRPEIRVRAPATTIAYQPDSQLANEDGFVGIPNVNLSEELTNNLQAAQAYKANAQIISTVKDMYEELLNVVDTKA